MRRRRGAESGGPLANLVGALGLLAVLCLLGSWRFLTVGFREQGALVHESGTNTHNSKYGSSSTRTDREERFASAGINSCVDRMRATVKVGMAVPSAPPISALLFGNMIELMGRQLRGGLLAQILVDRKFYHSAGTPASPWKLSAPARALESSEGRSGGVIAPLSTLDEDLYNDDGEIFCGAAVQDRLTLAAPSRRYTARVRTMVVCPSAPEFEVHIAPYARVSATLKWGHGDRDEVSVRNITVSAASQGAPRAEEFSIEAAENCGTGEVGDWRQGTWRPPSSDGSNDYCSFKISVYLISDPGIEGCHVAIGAASLMDSSHVHGFRRDALDAIKLLRPTSLRWPGGNFVSQYDWRDGVGEIDLRPPRINGAWSRADVEDNDMGIDEFLALCSLVDAEPILVINTGLGTIESAIAQYRYCSDKSPKVKWWGIGNEMYGSWQAGHIPLKQYVMRHTSFVSALTELDSTLRFIGVGDIGYRWSKTMLESTKMDIISEHIYSHSDTKYSNSAQWSFQCPAPEGKGRFRTCNGGDVVGHASLLAVQIKSIAEQYRRWRDAWGPDRPISKINVSLDEYNYWYGKEEFGRLGTPYFLQDALGIAAAFHEMFRHTDVFEQASYAQLMNVLGAIKANYKSVVIEPTGQALLLYQKYFGSGHVAPVKVFATMIPSSKWPSTDHNSHHSRRIQRDYYCLEEPDDPIHVDVTTAYDKQKKLLTLSFVNPESDGLPVVMKTKRWKLIPMSDTGPDWYNTTRHVLSGTAGPMSRNYADALRQVEIRSDSRILCDEESVGFSCRFDVEPLAITLCTLSVEVL